VLVQANHGDRYQLRVDGVPVGLAIPPDEVPTPWGVEPSLQAGSIIVIIATDAPLLPIQCKRLAQRATVGLGRVGGVGFNSSGDIFLAFSTGNDLPIDMPKAPRSVEMLPHQQLNPLFEAVADATEESILNALMAAETMTGFKGHTAHALPLDRLQAIMSIYDKARHEALPTNSGPTSPRRR
jgi:D-aminopeptidase